MAFIIQYTPFLALDDGIRSVSPVVAEPRQGDGERKRSKVRAMMRTRKFWPKRAPVTFVHDSLVLADLVALVPFYMPAPLVLLIPTVV